MLRAQWIGWAGMLTLLSASAIVTGCGGDQGSSASTNTGDTQSGGSAGQSGSAGSSGTAGTAGKGGTGGSSAGGSSAGGSSTGGSSTGGSSTGGSSTGGSSMSGSGGSVGGPCVKDTDCDNGLFCDGVEACVGGMCVEGSTPCDDGVACTVDACDEAAKACSHTANNVLCDDGVTCDGVEECSPIMGCLSGSGPICDDGVSCTTDFCDAVADQCVHANDDNMCQNGTFCDGKEVCDPAGGAAGTGCKAGAPINCDDGIGCTNDVCSEVTKACVHVAQNSACSDGLYCNGSEMCVPGVGCQAGFPINCDDGRSCTADSCDEGAKQCVHAPNPAACDDGLYCNGVEICSAFGPAPTGCGPGAAISCATDNVACTVDACDEASKQCLHTPSNALCPSGQLCAPASGGCTAAPTCNSNAQCDDGNPCNGVETCNIVCQPGTPKNCDDGVSCTIDSCNAMNGACVHATNNAACDDGLACNGIETCSAQTGCVAGVPKNCDDAVVCTADSCTEPAGTCAHAPNDAFCSDGVLCNGAEVCTANGCQAGAPFVCPSDGIACTQEVCDVATNSCKSLPQNNLCANGGTCDPAQGGCVACQVSTCQGKVYACGDCLDNDGDGKIDSADASCLGPCDNTESTFYGGIPGQNNSPCKSDCYFDQDTGSGNDDCYWSHKCDPLEVGPSYPPEGSQCTYNPNANIAGYPGTCMQAFQTQSAACLSYCGPLTPNGCDCFGCCAIPGAPTTVWLGSENPSGTGSCDLAHVADPAYCKPCTQVQACLNTCEHCELCVGKVDLPPDCSGSQTCSNGAQPCGLPGQPACPAGNTCITGCCQGNPQ